MSGELFVTLIEAVDGEEEGVGIGGVKHHRDTEFARFLEQRSESLIVNTEELTARVFQLKTEIFPQLDAAGSSFYEAFQTLDGAGEKPVLVQITPSGLQIETMVPPPNINARMNVVRLEIPYGRMRRRIDIPPGRYALVERRLDRGCLYLRLTKEAP